MIVKVQYDKEDGDENNDGHDAYSSCLTHKISKGRFGHKTQVGSTISARQSKNVYRL